MIFISLFFLFQLSAQSQVLGNGLVNDSGDYTSQLGSGAVTNRQTATSLYNLAMQHAAQAKATMNIGLGVQAFQEYQNAIHSDDQAHEFAQAALHGVNTGSNSGMFDLNNFTSLGTHDFNDLVTSSSPNYAQARAQAESYGLQMSEDRQYMKTPFGAFPTNMTSEEMVAIGSQIAAQYGIPASVIAAGMAAGQASSQDVAQKIAAAAQKLHLNRGDANAALAGAVGGEVATNNKSLQDLLPTDGEAGPSLRTPADSSLTGGAASKAATDFDATKVDGQLDSFRIKLLSQMGREPIHTPDQDIFQMIHDRYESVCAEHRLLDPSEVGSVASVDLSMAK